MTTPKTILEMLADRNELINELSDAPDQEKQSLHLRINNIETLITQRKDSYGITR